MMIKKLVYSVFIAFGFIAFASCSDDDEVSEYALLTAEMCDFNCAQQYTFTKAVTDNDETLAFESAYQCSWATKTDSTYRALLYYNKVEGQKYVRPIMVDQAMCLLPHTKNEGKSWSEYHDPVSLVASWFAPNGKYLNMRLSIKTGTADDKQKHSLGLICDTITEKGGAKNYQYRLCHNSNGLPEFYSFEVFTSIPMSGICMGDTITLSIPTRDGMMKKVYIKPN